MQQLCRYLMNFGVYRWCWRRWAGRGSRVRMLASCWRRGSISRSPPTSTGATSSPSKWRPSPPSWSRWAITRSRPRSSLNGKDCSWRLLCTNTKEGWLKRNENVFFHSPAADLKNPRNKPWVDNIRFIVPLFFLRSVLG
jgi:hypothetical protein